MANAKRPQHARRPAGTAARASGAGGTGRPAGAGRPQQGGAARQGGVASAKAVAQTKPQASALPLSRGAQRRRQSHQPWWERYKWTLAAGLVVVLLIGLFYLMSRGQQDNPAIGSAVPDSVMHAVSQPDASVWGKVGTAGLKNPFIRAGGNAGNGGDFLKGSNGHPEVFYAGAEYCPYCAAERWSLVMALSRFGSFKNLHFSASSSTDSYANTSTFTFVGSSYESKYIDFAPVELQDRDQKPLQTMTPDQQNLFAKYDQPPYVVSGKGSIPFLSIANQYMTNGSGYDVGVLTDKTWQDIAGRLNNPQDDMTKKIVGNANYITAAICQVTNQQPGDVCTAAPIPDIQKQLNGGK